MIDQGKKNILGIGVSAIDYEAAVDRIADAAKNRKSLKVTALAVHGVMTGALDKEHRYRLNTFDLVSPDGQPVRWALNLLHGCKLTDRVYGPDLTLKVCDRAARDGLSVFLYGSKLDVIEKMQQRLLQLYPDLKIAGSRASLFRRSTNDEKNAIVEELRASGADIMLVGLGCPRQEVWVYEYADLLQMPALAVGAAFDFHAGLLSQAPRGMQDRGLEWLYRLIQEPRRLWRRYLVLNPMFLTMLFAQAARLVRYSDRGKKPSHAENYA